MSYTYAALKTAIQDYCDSNESTFVTHLPDFIKSAEERIFKSVQLNIFKKNASGNFTSGNKYLSVPSDFLAPLSVAYTNGDGLQVSLLQKQKDYIQEFINPSTTGAPRYYAQFDYDSLIIGPTPDSSYTVEMSYYYRPSSLTTQGESGTTWLSENAPNAMLFGSIVEAMGYLKAEADLLQLYQARFGEALAGLKMLGEAKETSDLFASGEIVRPKQ